MIEAQRDIKAILDRLERLEKPDIGDVSGTWTPVFAGTGTAGSFTYSVQQGNYTRIGNVVTVWGNIALSAISVAPTGNMRITGLPFTAVNTTNQFGNIAFTYIHNFNFAAGALGIGGRIIWNTSIITLAEWFDNANAVEAPAANFTNAACQMLFFGSYQIT